MMRDAIVREARALVGTPYRHQGRSGVGIDCAGVPIVIAKKLGLVADDFDRELGGYPREPDGFLLQQHCDRFMLRIAWAAAKAGDVLLVRWGTGVPQHLGVLVPYRHGGWSMIHAENRRHRRVCETRVVFGSEMQLVCAYRMPGVNDE